MEGIDKEVVESKIIEAIKQTKIEIKDYLELTKPISPESSLGRISRMDAINNKTINEAALRKAKIRLTNLELAKTKLNSPDFGKCNRCKTQIPLGRILLIPQSKLCVRCAN